MGVSMGRGTYSMIWERETVDVRRVGNRGGRGGEVDVEQTRWGGRSLFDSHLLQHIHVLIRL